jgi:hypothetical protein
VFTLGYLNDELGVSWMSDLEAHYDWTAATDPDHVAWSVLYEAPELRQYMATFDVIGTDPYPINAPPGSGQPAKVGAEADVTRNQTGGARPMWEVIQAHNLRD